MTMQVSYGPHDVLLVVDMQNDFCEGGALAVTGGSALVVASRDWHPIDHVSFTHRGGPWPVHCVQDTPGAAFHPDLALPEEAIRVSKATAFDADAYSAFDGTGLDGYLRDRGIKRVVLCGLAMDVCVQATAQDARRKGFEVLLLARLTEPVAGEARDICRRELEEAGIEVHT